MHNFQQTLRQNILEITGFVVILLSGVLGLIDLFREMSPQRWLAAGLVALLLFLNLSTHYHPWWYDRVWRQRLAMALMTLITLALLFPSHQTGIFAIIFFVLSVTAAMLFEPREWALWIAGFAIATMVFYIRHFGWSDGLFSGLTFASGYYFFASFAKATADAKHAQEESERLYAELQSAHKQLQAYASQAEDLAVAGERNRLAREMHDTVGHRLTTSAVQLQAIQKLIARDPARAQEMTATVQEQIAEALSELRQSVAALRAPIEEDLSLATSLHRLTTQFAQATGLDIDLQIPASLPPLPPAHRRALYRAAQESLTNVQKHAQAQHVWVQVQVTTESLALLVSDDGVGVGPRQESGGFGLLGLQERAAQLGGEFHLIPRPGRGSQAIFHIPHLLIRRG